MTLKSVQLQKMLGQGLRGNPLERIAALERGAGEKFFNPLRVDTLSDISDEFGLMFPPSVYPFGNGMDGDVEISATTILSRPMYYRNLTITNNAIVYVPASYVYVSETLTIESGSRLCADGEPGVDGAPGDGGNGGRHGGYSSGVRGMWGYGFPGAAGATPAASGLQNGSGGIVTAPTVQLLQHVPLGMAVGISGAGGGGHGSTSGGEGGSVPEMTFAYALGGAGGSSIGVGLDGVTGGGGGGGGGFLYLAVNIVNNMGAISANGGNGGSGEVSGSILGGNGGGGGGGSLYVLYNTETGSGIGAPTASGGAAGTNGNGGSAGADGIPEVNYKIGVTI